MRVDGSGTATREGEREGKVPSSIELVRLGTQNSQQDDVICLNPRDGGDGGQMRGPAVVEREDKSGEVQRSGIGEDPVLGVSAGGVDGAGGSVMPETPLRRAEGGKKTKTGYCVRGGGRSLHSCL